MQQDKVDMYMLSHTNFFPVSKVSLVREKLLQADDSKYTVLVSVELKYPIVMLMVSIFGGILGIDRFMLGDTAMGILKLLTAGGCYIFYIVDWFLVQDRTKQLNYDTVMSLLI